MNSRPKIRQELCLLLCQAQDQTFMIFVVMVCAILVKYFLTREELSLLSVLFDINEECMPHKQELKEVQEIIAIDPQCTMKSPKIIFKLIALG